MIPVLVSQSRSGLVSSVVQPLHIVLLGLPVQGPAHRTRIGSEFLSDGETQEHLGWFGYTLMQCHLFLCLLHVQSHLV
ncbi:hypothetical protein B0O80DRAFT_186459 [Mortierella sp. GBAus27b]|nr:hypothetical protein B0O80DRAFT_186459 [Mortierella sp. GBAus27b]